MASQARVRLAASAMLSLPALAYLLRDAGPIYWAVTSGVGVSASTLLAGVLAVALFPPTRRAVVWTGFVAGIAFLTQSPVGSGTLYVSGLPLVLGAWAGFRSLQHGEPAFLTERTAFSCTFLGILVGGDLIHLATSGTDAASGIAVIGGAGIADALVFVPVLTAAWTGMWRGLVDEDEPVGEDDDAWGIPTLRRWLGHRDDRDTRMWLNCGWASAIVLWLVVWLA